MKKGLGKGLAALIGDLNEDADNEQIKTTKFYINEEKNWESTLLKKIHITR